MSDVSSSLSLMPFDEPSRQVIGPTNHRAFGWDPLTDEPLGGLPVTLSNKSSGRFPVTSASEPSCRSCWPTSLWAASQPSDSPCWALPPNSVPIQRESNSLFDYLLQQNPLVWHCLKSGRSSPVPSISTYNKQPVSIWCTQLKKCRQHIESWQGWQLSVRIQLEASFLPDLVTLSSAIEQCPVLVLKFLVLPTGWMCQAINDWMNGLLHELVRHHLMEWVQLQLIMCCETPFYKMWT